MNMVVMAPVLLAFGALFIAILLDWRRGLIGLILFLPFAGIISILAANPLAVLAKDLLIVAPTYLAYVLTAYRSTPLIRPSPLFLAATGALIFASVVQLANPNLLSMAVGLVGLKVWLFYVPMLLLAGAFVRDGDDLRRLLRIFVVVAPIPCLVGLAQWLAATFLGYKFIMFSIYGQMAENWTQGFTSFQYSAGFSLFRLFSTFAAPAQYFGFAYSMIFVTWIAIRVENAGPWKTYAVASFYLAIAATLLSGSRQALVFVPFALVLLTVLGRSTSPKAIVAVLLASIAAVPLAFATIPLESIFFDTSRLVGHYRDTLFFAGLVDALENFPWGLGTGMNTGSARYVIADPDWEVFENFYAKAAYEFGVIGPVIVVALFAGLIGAALQLARFGSSPVFGACGAAFAAFYIAFGVNCLKGWQLDLDPVNVYFWLFAGILFRVRVLASRAAPASPARNPFAVGRQQTVVEVDTQAIGR